MRTRHENIYRRHWLVEYTSFGVFNEQLCQFQVAEAQVWFYHHQQTSSFMINDIHYSVILQPEPTITGLSGYLVIIVDLCVKNEDCSRLIHPQPPEPKNVTISFGKKYYEE